ncbi:DsbA family protein [Vibrio metoecus]|uniref:DsbA family protein n=1 Tax=Vibrio metoecus TaxID=1481663 RepID=UPI00300D9689
MVRVHYIFDPMCGWCFGATSLMEALAQHPTAELVLHPGGMMNNAQIRADFRAHILQADQRIQRETGAQFGEAYLERVRSSQPLVLDSYLTAQAIMATRLAGKQDFDMLKAIQRAHYQQGLDVTQAEVLQQLAQALEIAPEAWQNAMLQAATQVQQEVAQTQRLMQQLGLGGFPSLAIEKNNEWYTLSPSHYYGRPQEWQQWLKTL